MENNKALHYLAFVKGTSEHHFYIEEIFSKDPRSIALIENLGKGHLEYLLWSNLNDTPYTQGRVKLANWNNRDDKKRARAKS